jgi:hypothetical protein
MLTRFCGIQSTGSSVVNGCNKQPFMGGHEVLLT